MTIDDVLLVFSHRRCRQVTNENAQLRAELASLQTRHMHTLEVMDVMHSDEMELVRVRRGETAQR